MTPGRTFLPFALIPQQTALEDIFAAVNLAGRQTGQDYLARWSPEGHPPSRVNSGLAGLRRRH